MAALALLALVLGVPPLAACPASSAPADAPGTLTPFRDPLPRAAALNVEARALYRQRRYAEAHARFAEAAALDPEFATPQLYAACTLVWQERYVEAAALAARLVRRAYVPWARDVAETADLRALRARPEQKVIDSAVAEAALSWGAAVARGVFFLARTRAPLRLPADGVAVLGLHQDVYAYDPTTGRTLAVTAEDGRVLAFVRSPDGRTLTTVIGNKLLRSGGASQAHRGLALRSLDIATMRPGPVLPIEGDVREIRLWHDHGTAVVAIQDPAGTRRWLRAQPGGGSLTSTGARPRGADAAAVIVSAHTVTTGPGFRPVIPATNCLRSARDDRGTSPPSVKLRPLAGADVQVQSPLGASLAGLPFD